MRNDPFPGLGRAALAARIADARLSETDAKIARMRLLDDMDFADIAAAVHYSRSTVSSSSSSETVVSVQKTCCTAYRKYFPSART